MIKSIFNFIRRVLSDRIIMSGILMLIQVFILLSFIVFISDANPLFYTLFQLISVCMVIWLVRKEDNPAYKISWIIIIFTFPISGGVLFLIWGNTPFNKTRMKNIQRKDRSLFSIPDLSVSSESLIKINPNYKRISDYVNKTGGFPLYENSNCEYLKIGEDFYESLIENLKNAEKFIFMEFFIVEHGYMWDNILEILKEKVSKGVEVRFMYDDAGCLGTLPPSYHKILAEYGINCVRFNPFRPTLTTYLNNRDHRKICVIDGEIGYTGGINLADEYINKRERFGHWKDMAIVFDGQSVTSLTLMFLELWEVSCGAKEQDTKKYLSHKKNHFQGYIQPFSDSPVDSYNVSENVYMQMINSAQKYIYITTPYLVLDNEMITALIIASQSGVDVKIITPHIPDKPYVHAVTRSFYLQLIEAGIEIYEYSPGFMHGKVAISDDNIAVVGTINMDFRSFYMHFECGTLLFDCPAIKDIKKDILQTFEVSQKYTKEEFAKTPRSLRIIHSILRIFAPMM